MTNNQDQATLVRELTAFRDDLDEALTDAIHLGRDSLAQGTEARRDLLSRALEALTTVPQGTWQPIETAPKDALEYRSGTNNPDGDVHIPESVRIAANLSPAPAAQREQEVITMTYAQIKKIFDDAKASPASPLPREQGIEELINRLERVSESVGAEAHRIGGTVESRAFTRETQTQVRNKLIACLRAESYAPVPQGETSCGNGNASSVGSSVIASSTSLAPRGALAVMPPSDALPVSGPVQQAAKNGVLLARYNLLTYLLGWEVNSKVTERLVDALITAVRAEQEQNWNAGTFGAIQDEIDLLKRAEQAEASLSEANKQLKNLVELEAAYRENERQTARRLSLALTLGGAATWDEIIHAAEESCSQLAAAQAEIATLRKALEEKDEQKG